MVLLPAAPALAHGVAGVQSGNIASEVTGLVDVAAPNAAQGGEPVQVADSAGITWSVLGGDSYLRLENRSEAQVIVLGYEREPYLRIGPGGVERNERSPATYLNADRFAQTPVPRTADASFEPVWQRVADEPVWAWHDHRMQWMGEGLPPEAVAAPGEEHLLADWVVPITVDGRRLGVAGTLRWVPPVPAWPWWVLAAVLVGLPWIIRIAQGRGEGVTARRVTAATLGALAVVALALAIDEVLAAPVVSVGERVSGAVQSLAFVVIAAAAAWAAWRGAQTARLALVVAGVTLAGFGAAEASALTASQLASVMPSAITRTAIAATMVGVVPAIVGALLAREPAEDDVEQPVYESTTSFSSQ